MKHVTTLPSIPGLSYQQVPGDGHCLFHAVGLHVGQDQASLRRLAAEHLENHKDFYRAFIPAGQALENYIQVLKEGKEWADNIEIEILMRVLDRQIIVIGPDGNIQNRDTLERRFNGEPIFVFYNGRDHYDAFLREGEITSQSIINYLLLSRERLRNEIQSERTERISPLPVQSDQPKRNRLPQIVHTVWAGGTDKITDDDLRVILRRALANPEWKQYIWVDEKTDPEVISSNYYKDAFARLLQDEEFEKCGEEIKKKVLTNLFIQDIKALRDEYISYEIDKLTPNYGSSSDLLRYIILYIYGGAYFDTDVYAGTNTLDEIPVKEADNYIIYLDHYPQHPRIHQHLLADFEHFAAIGNDAFITTKNNPFVLELCNIAKRNYDLESNKISCAYGGKNIKNITESRTGPLIVSNLMLQSELVRGEAAHQHYRVWRDVNIYRLRDGKICLSMPAPDNESNWLNLRVVKKDYKEALQRVAGTIAFEMKHFGVIRVDDHILDVLISGGVYHNEELTLQAQESYRTIIGNSILEECQKYIDQKPMVQVTGRFDETVNFFEKSSCKTLFHLHGDELKSALICLLRPWFFERGIEEKTVERLESKLASCLIILTNNLEFMEGILRNSNHFDNEQLIIICKSMDEILDEYNEFSKHASTILKKNLGDLDVRIINNAVLLKDIKQRFLGNDPGKCVIA